MSSMQPPRRVPYLGYTLFIIYSAFVVLAITFLVIYAHRASEAYQAHQYAEMVFQACMGTVASVAFHIFLKFGRFAFFTQPVPEV